MSNWVEFPETESFETFDRPKYLRFEEGTPLVVRILDKQVTHVRKHWINRARTSLLCLEEACPICAQNAKIRQENPKNFRKVQGYIPYQNRYMVNVLDRTPVIIDPETGDEYYAGRGGFPAVTKDGERSLVNIEPQPSNTVKILERGKTLFEQLLAIHLETSELDDNDNVISGGITSFDIKFVTMGDGRDKVISPIALMNNKDDVAGILEQNELVPHVLSAVSLQLTPSEMEAVAYAGVSVADIFAQRRAEEESEALSPENLSDASKRVEGLFDTNGDDEELTEY